MPGSMRSGGCQTPPDMRTAKMWSTPPSRLTYAVAPAPSRAKSTSPELTMSALGPSSESAGKNAAPAGVAGTRISRRVRRCRARMDRGSNRGRYSKLRPAGVDAFRAGLGEPRLGLRVDTAIVPSELGRHRLRDPPRGLFVTRQRAGSQQPETCPAQQCVADTARLLGARGVHRLGEQVGWS